MPPTTVTLTVTPNPIIMASQFGSWGGSIGEFGEPLKTAVERVVAPSIATNFESGGRPSWEPLMPQTLERKPGGGAVLVRTGLLKATGSSPSIWQIGDEDASLQSGSLGSAYYGAIHQEGSRNMSARVWAILQPQDVDQIEEILGDWAGTTAARAGVIAGFMGTFGRFFGGRRR